jgi:hypothetical protein
LRDVLALCTQQDFAVSRLRVDATERGQSGFQAGKGQSKGADEEDVSDLDAPAAPRGKGVVTVAMEIRGVKSLSKLIARLSEVSGVVAVNAGEDLASE